MDTSGHSPLHGTAPAMVVDSPPFPPAFRGEDEQSSGGSALLDFPGVPPMQSDRTPTAGPHRYPVPSLPVSATAFQSTGHHSDSGGGARPPHHALHLPPPAQLAGHHPTAAASGSTNIELPPIMAAAGPGDRGAPPPQTSPFPAHPSDPHGFASAGSGSGGGGPIRPSLPPLMSLTGMTANGHGTLSPLLGASASAEAAVRSPPHLFGGTPPNRLGAASPATPSHSQATASREYFPPVPITIGPAKSAPAPTTMVLLLTFMDMRVIRASDETQGLLGHHPMQLASRSLSELLHRTDRPKLVVLREWLRWVVCSASGLSEAHLTRFSGSVAASVFQRPPAELARPAPDWPAHIIIEDNVHFRVADGEYRQFRIRLYVGGPDVLVGRAETWDNACVVCEVRRHIVPTMGGVGNIAIGNSATHTAPPMGLPLLTPTPPQPLLHTNDPGSLNYPPPTPDPQHHYSMHTA